MTYAEKLKDPRWQKRRLKVMEYAHWRCQICGVKDRTLHCHHSYYTRGKQPWQYPEGAIICICEKCHGLIHPKPPAKTPERVEAHPPNEELPSLPRIAAMSRFTAMRAMLEKVD